jgi:hypothetical protein
MSGIGWGQDTPLDVVQTVALIVMTCVLIYAVWKIGRAMDDAMKGLRDPLLVVVRDNAEVRRLLAVQWKRIEALEDRAAAAEATKERLETLEERIGAVERRPEK